MIIYATKQTIERYKLTMPDEFSDPVIQAIASAFYEEEQGDRLLEWGAKLFYFDRRKCIQVCNFASKFTIILVDVKIKNLEYIGDAIFQYMMDVYSDDKETSALVEQYFKDQPFVCFGKLTDRSIISSLNHFQSWYLEDGYRLYDFIKDNVLQTKELNRKINKDYITTAKVDGKTQYFVPAEKFAELIRERY